MNTTNTPKQYTQLQECVDKGVNLNWTFKGGADMQHAGMTPLALAAALNKPQALQVGLITAMKVSCVLYIKFSVFFYFFFINYFFY